MRHVGWTLVAMLSMALSGAGCQQVRRAPPAEDRTAVVRGELEARYAENEAGFRARDPDRVMRLRHPEFHTITPDGNVSSREQMYERTRSFIARIERFDSLSEAITALALEGDTAHAVVDQRTLRQQRLPDGKLHEVRTSVVQRESWVKTPGGWLLWRVDQIRPGETLVDGKPQSPADLPPRPPGRDPRGGSSDPGNVRKQLEAEYERNRQAFLRKDLDAIMALRAADFHAVTPDGKRHDREEMRQQTEALLNGIKRWNDLTFDIDSLDVVGDEARAIVRQHADRHALREDGRVHHVETWVTQREIWVRTSAGWKLHRVDGLRDRRRQSRRPRRPGRSPS